MKKDKYINIFKKEDGAGLVLALMVLVVLAVLGVAVAGVTIGSHKLGDISRDSNSAFYIAEAGANLAYEKIKNGVMPAYESSSNDETIYFNNIAGIIAAFNPTEYAEEIFETQFGDQPRATVTISGPEDSDGGKRYTIESIGEIDGKSRTVKKSFLVKFVKRGGIGLPKMPEGAVLIAYGTLKFDTNTKIYGDIYLDENGQAGFHQNFHHEVNGAEYKNLKGIIDDQPIDMQPYKDIYDAFPEFPSTTSYMTSFTGNTISENTYLEKLKVSSTLTINTNGKPINIVVDDFSTEKNSNNVNINVVGSGTVNLFVNNSMSFISNNLNINQSGETDQFNILYAGSKTVEFKNNITFNGSFFSRQAKMSFENNLKIDGILISFGDIEIKNNSKITASIYAPNNTVTFKNNGDLKGTIVADSINSGNNIKFSYYLNPYLENYPYGTGEGGTGPGSGAESTLENLITSQPSVEP